LGIWAHGVPKIAHVNETSIVVVIVVVIVILFVAVVAF